ncbi:MAG TPA: FAD/NAD(P)-binding protein, partial [Candidatus Obscuribacterales bacterium]
MDGSTTRRDFLKQLAIFLAAGSGAALADALAQQAARAWPELRGELKIAPWTGDDFTFGHRLRDLKTPVFPDKIERTVDFVIIGGGIAGLCAAYYLKDHNFLLLEQYEDLGGHARGGNYKGIGYSYASQYFNYADGLIGELLHALGLNPVKLDTTKNAWLWEKNWLPGVSGQDSNVA